MGEADKKEDKSGRRFSQEQYEMLKKCSEEGEEGIKKWNEWRKKNPDEDILLEGANLTKCYLKGVYLNKGGNPNFPGEVHMKKASFGFANLGKARLDDAHLENAELGIANLEGAVLIGAHLEDAHLIAASMRGATLQATHLEGAGLFRARLEGANLSFAYLQGTEFELAIVNGFTELWKSKIDNKTNFRGVNLDVAKIDPGTKQLLKYNIRRMNWEDWYKEHWLLAWLVKPFWGMSDYGMSTLRVVGVFFLLALLFAAVYMNWAYWRPPGIVSKLIVQPEVGEAVWHYFGRALIRPVYFSIVTMTTLGFGDMYANKGSIAGHVILAVQVILGYVLLGALITRFAVLFTAGGPAGKFEESGKGPG